MRLVSGACACPILHLLLMPRRRRRSFSEGLELSVIDKGCAMCLAQRSVLKGALVVVAVVWFWVEETA